MYCGILHFCRNDISCFYDKRNIFVGISVKGIVQYIWTNQLTFEFVTQFAHKIHENWFLIFLNVGFFLQLN